jgi:pimeloyl-ACP methyl ester carboxylesterase
MFSQEASAAMCGSDSGEGAEILELPGSGGITLRARCRGSAESAALLLVHGLASNASLWDATARELESCGYRSVALDLRGHGSSDRPAWGYDFATLLADLREALSRLEQCEGPCWRRPVVVGQSMGANLAIELAAADPDRVASVVCVDGGMIELRGSYESWSLCAQALAPPDLRSYTRSQLAAMLREAHPTWPSEGVEALLASFSTGQDGRVCPLLTRQRHMCLLRELWDHPPSRLLHRVRVPVLLVLADGGAGVPFSVDKARDVERAEAALACVRVHWFGETDHDIHVQRPRELATLICQSLSDGFLQ